MFLPFFQTLREEGVPVSVREFLGFLEAMAVGLVTYDPEGFYHLARAVMVKDERHIDRFDRAFARAFSGLDAISSDQVLAALDLPSDWLEKACRTPPFGGRTRRDHGFGRVRQADGNAAPAPCRPEGPPSGRVEMDRHGGDFAIRGPWLQPPKAYGLGRRAGGTGGP